MTLGSAGLEARATVVGLSVDSPRHEAYASGIQTR